MGTEENDLGYGYVRNAGNWEPITQSPDKTERADSKSRNDDTPEARNAVAASDQRR